MCCGAPHVSVRSGVCVPGATCGCARAARAACGASRDAYDAIARMPELARGTRATAIVRSAALAEASVRALLLLLDLCCKQVYLVFLVVFFAAAA